MTRGAKTKEHSKTTVQHYLMPPSPLLALRDPTQARSRRSVGAFAQRSPEVETQMVELVSPPLPEMRQRRAVEYGMEDEEGEMDAAMGIGVAMAGPKEPVLVTQGVEQK